MEKKIIELLGMVFRLLIRCWAQDSKVASQNLVDFEQFAQKCGLDIWDSQKFQLTIQGFVMEISQNFIKETGNEIESSERKAEILNQIQRDVEKISIDEKRIICEFSKPETLRNAIMEIGIEDRETWSDKEKAVYANCVKYISKASVDFVSKWPSFTPEALKVIVQRQDEYNIDIHNILKELRAMETLIRSTEVTYRDFESRYRETIIERYGKVELIGSGLNERSVRKYDIFSAYVELNCFEDGYEDEIELSQVFGRDNVVWLGGEAGSGKTTFLRWVAICSAKNDYKKIENIRNTIPIVIELRSIRKWPLNLQVIVNEFSDSFGYKCPNGWLDKILNDSRALILIDGLDEITENKRDKTYDFIENLLEKYPKTKILVTTRNSIENNVDCFNRRYEISPMKIKNIKNFIFYWHRSILHSDAIVEDGEIRELQNNLIVKITNSSSLKLLARNPLLCAMICALNYVNNQHLPENKMDLYESCCRMLMDARDAERQITSSVYESLQKLDYSKKKRVLEEMAYWMLRNNNSLEKRDNVIDFFNKLFENTNIIPRAELECKTDTILDFFVERSGIIREPEEGVIDFIHKTFMEYLAVKSICRNCDWNKLVEQACNSNWKETIIMCFSEMGESQVSQVLMELVKKGKSKKDDRYILMASLGASNAIFTNLEIRNQIDKQITKMIPPKREQISEIAQAGSYLLPFLIDSDKFSEGEKERCLSLLEYLGIEDILPDVVSYVGGNGTSLVKKLALEILSQYGDNILCEYSVKEQLQEILFRSIKEEELISYEMLLNIISDVKLGEKDRKILRNIQFLKIICGIDSDNIYYGCTEFYKYFSNVENLYLEGDIQNIKFLEEYNKLRVLTIDGIDLSRVVEELGEIKLLENVEEFILYAEYLRYFCENDLKNMPNLKCLEIHCLDNELEIDFGDFECIKKLEKFVIEVDCYLANEIEWKISSWKQKLSNLKVVFV